MNERPTLSEVAKARPRRGTGVPPRCISHKSAILALLVERGEHGVLGSELYNSPEKFGRSPRNRIGELRKEGCLISGKPHGTADWHYVLMRDGADVKPSMPFFDREAGSQTDYMRRRYEEESAAMPLFVGARP
jgi:hypothetical protein